MDALPHLPNAEKFLHEVVDEMNGGLIAWQLRYPDLSPKDIDRIKVSSSTFFRQAVGENLNKEQVVSLLQSGKYIKGEALKQAGMAIITVWSSRREEIQKSLKDVATNQFAETKLADFDWRVQLTMSSDRISVLRDPLTLLNLILDSNNGKPRQEVLLELPKEELHKLIDTLEKVNGVVQDLKV
ncbi:hypothetical protein PROFUN_01541 [Planoprotostelium fungivorum]|uniref:COMM domain-containing protein n=1 Tax=Planoprotostelium fungivorum TaxID=1890364 RepID=A0A2P6NTH4_9EUKA|nr:hypothetical protein PROFUN_01541 [Planoprotostelium fungivorum]